jgi:hypothetical protein
VAEEGDAHAIVKGGRELTLAGNGPLKAEKFNKKSYEQGDLYSWSSLRSAYLAEANVNAAGFYADYGWGPWGLGWWGADWYWDPWFDAFTFIPAMGFSSAPSAGGSIRRGACLTPRFTEGTGTDTGTGATTITSVRTIVIGAPVPTMLEVNTTRAASTAGRDPVAVVSTPDLPEASLAVGSMAAGSTVVAAASRAEEASMVADGICEPLAMASLSVVVEINRHGRPSALAAYQRTCIRTNGSDLSHLEQFVLKCASVRQAACR